MDEKEERTLYEINTLRNLAIHSAKPVSQEEFEKALEEIEDLLKRLR
ncbi:MAG: hypothetical protein Q6368_007205 [Candidatus Baldrarchaeota archaeon]